MHGEHETRAARVQPGATTSRWAIAILWLLVLATNMHAISAEDLWWHLSRGRAVSEGQVAPSRSLLVSDSIAEADWLGGWPFYLLYQLGGLSALMVCKLVVAGLLVTWAWRSTTQQDRSIRLLVATGLALVAAQLSEPTPLVWDVAGLMIACHLLDRARKQFTILAPLGLGTLAVAWANLAPGCLLIVLPLVDEAIRRSRFRSSRVRSCNLWWLGGAACLGMCLSPRGVFTLWDSTRQLAPLLVESRAILLETVWRPVWEGDPDSSVLGWALLGGMSIVGLIRQSAVFSVNGLWLLVILSLGAWSRPFAMVSSVWLVRWIAEIWPATGWIRFQRPTGRLLEAHVADLKLGTQPAFDPSIEPARVMRPLWLERYAARTMTVFAPCLCVVVAIASVWGVSPVSDSRLSWGLSHPLETRILAASLVPALSLHEAQTSIPSSAHCTDVRSTGMLAWLRVSSIRPYLVAQRALLNGKLRDEVLINRELQTGWLKQHRRSDGTSGGWWLPLRQRKTRLLLVSAEQTELIRSLGPTIWKPLALDSPVVPFALAGDPRFTEQMAEVVAQQRLVDRGVWAFQPEPAVGNDVLLNLAGWLTDQPANEPILRQSALLRAFGLPVAALRVLRPLLPGNVLFPKVHREWLACQQALSEREFLTIGQVSEFRRQALDIFRMPFDSKRPGATTDSTDLLPSADWSPAVAIYASGEPHRAAELLKLQTPAMMFAQAMLEWEAGRLDDARRVWTELQRQFPESRYSLASRYALESDTY